MKRFFAFIITICIVMSAISLTVSAEAECIDVAQAADILRAAMVNRKNAITVNYKTESEPTSESLEALFMQSVAENGESTSGDYLYWHIESYSASGSYWPENGYYYCDITFEVIYYTTKRQEDELTTAINKLITSFGFTQSTDDYTKIKTVYEYICSNVDYDYDNLNDDNYNLKYSAYAALINKTAICQGYANLFYRLLHELGINNRIISGISSNQRHAWNIIELDGVFYNADSTWDAGLDEYMFFLKCEDHFDDHLRNIEYSDSTFLTAYPMAEECYNPAPESDLCNKFGHDMGDWYVYREATETEDGEDRRGCVRCDHFESRVTHYTEETEIKLGDVNGNGTIEIYDYLMVKRAVMETLTFDEAQIQAADINGDNAVDKLDYLLVKRHVMGTFVIAA